MNYATFIKKLNHSHKTNQPVYILDDIVMEEGLVESIITSIKDNHVILEHLGDGYIEHYSTTELYDLIGNPYLSFEEFFNGR
jgi:hypothetical protein